MKSQKDLLRQAHEMLSDLGANPRSELMLALSEMIESPDEVPTGEIHLRATIAPGGVHEVTDQHGRKVSGVKSVAMFDDPRGDPVFQVNM